MPSVTPDRYTLPFTVLPPVFGTTFSAGPPTSASPMPPDVVIATSCALPTSAMYAETPPPLNADPTLIPSSCRRPSLLRPPAPPNTTMPGTTCTSDAAPDATTVFGISVMRPAYARADGIAVMRSLLIVVCRRTLCVSTIGVSPVTVIVSASAPTFRSALTTALNEPLSSMPSRRTALNPTRVNDTVYAPARRSTMRYWPAPSVTAVRAFSIRTGLVASTVTPGRTAPDASLTTPAMDACAYADSGSARIIEPTSRICRDLRIRNPPSIRLTDRPG